MRRITTDSLTNQNIATALLLATYTADADRMLYINVRADQVAGAGDYVVYLTRQHLGAGSHFRQMPQTTATVPSGVTSIAFPSIGLPVKNTDVIKVYLTGLAGDTTTPDTVVEWWEDELFITVGAAGAGLTAVGDTAGTTTLLSRITALIQTKAEADTAHALLATASALSSVATSASAAASSAASAAASAATAATQATTAATQSTASAIRTALGMAAANLDTQFGLVATAAKLLKYVQLMVRKDAAIATDNAVELMAINASGGSGAGAFASTTDSQEGIRDAISAGSASAEDIAAELVGIGAYVSAPSSTPAVGSLGVFVRATTWIMPAISVGALPVDREKLWFTVKTDPGLDDSAAILMVEETDGLLVLNGEEADDDTAASITYDDVDDEVTPRVETAATAAISPRGCLYFDVKYRAAGGADHYQVASGTFAVVWPITNAT